MKKQTHLILGWPGVSKLSLNFNVLVNYSMTYVPSRSLRSASEWRIIVPSQRGTKSLSQTFTLTVPTWWNDLPNSNRAAESLHLQETAKNTSLPSLFDPLTLVLSILILFYLSVFFLIKNTYTHLTLYQLHIYSLTASFSWKTNTSFFFLFNLLVSLKKTLGFFFLYSIYSFS